MSAFDNPAPPNTVININVTEEADRRVWVVDTRDEVEAMLNGGPEFITVRRVMGGNAVPMTIRVARIITFQKTIS